MDNQLNKEQIEFLSYLYDHPEERLILKDFLTEHSQFSLDLIRSAVAYLNWSGMGDAPILINRKGKAIIESIRREEEETVRHAQLDAERLSLERQAVCAAQEANRLSEEANRKSGRANLISWISMIFSAIAAISALASILYQFFQ